MITSEILKNAGVFSQLTEHELESILPLAEERSFQTNAIIVTEGEPATHLFVVTNGQVVIEAVINLGPTQPPRRVELDVVRPGGSIGWSALVPPFRYTANARALEHTTLIAMDGQRLRAVCDENPHLGLAVMRGVATVMADRLKVTRARLVSEWGLCMIYDEHPAY